MCELVTFTAGFTVPLRVVRLAMKLEAAGCTFALDGDDLVITPARLVSAYDRELVREWRDDLKRLVTYDPPAPL